MSEATAHTTVRASVATTLTLLLGLALLGPATAPTQAAEPTSSPTAGVIETPDRARASAAHWIATDLAAHDYQLPGPVGSDTDWGLTADAVFALASLGHAGDAGRATAQAIRDAGATPYPPYNVGIKAKAALAMQVAGLDPRNIPTDTGTLDLIADVRATLLPTGQFKYANHFGQSLAVLALARTAEGAPTAAIDYLGNMQCREATHANLGGFGFSVNNACGSVDGDATGMITAALMGVDGHAQRPAITDAVAWMVRRQRSDGSFAPQHAAVLGNTNSTGLVASAALGVRTPDALTVATRATGFVRGLQVTCASPLVAGTTPDTGGGFIDDWRGAVAYSTASYDEGVTDGVPPNRVDTWRRATQQAVLALGDKSLGELDLSTATPGVPTLPSCLPDAPTPTPTVPATPPVPPTAPSSTAQPSTQPTTQTPTQITKGRLRLQVTKRARAGSRVTIRVRGLERRERVVIRITGSKKVKVRASSGRVVLKFRTPHRTGRKTVRVIALDSDRRAKTTFRVTRR